MPTLTLGDLDQRVAALDARVRALEASHPPADTSVSPETRSADSGPENARHEEEIADLKRQLSASQALVYEHTVENARLERLVDELREQLKVQTQDARYFRSRLAQAKEAARRELADDLLEKLGVSNDD